MEITSDQLRVRMAAQTRAELEAIVTSTGKYTDEAVAAAGEELARRPKNGDGVDEGVPVSASVSPIADKVRSLSALLLSWIAWALLLTAFRLTSSLAIEGLLFGCLAGAIAVGLLWLARKVSVAATRLLVVVPAFLGALWFCRALPGNAEAGFNAAFFIVSAVVVTLFRRVAARRSAVSEAGG